MLRDINPETVKIRPIPAEVHIAQKMIDDPHYESATDPTIPQNLAIKWKDVTSCILALQGLYPEEEHRNSLDRIHLKPILDVSASIDFA